MMVIRRKTKTRAFLLIALATVLFVPTTAMAYLIPEDVLMGNDLYIPPSDRETQDRVLEQAQRAAARREEEWQKVYEKQHPAPIEPEYYEEDPYIILESEEAPVTITSDTMELLRTIRLLERVDTRQDELRHSGAQPLAPTGAPAVIAMVTMIGAAGWTVFRSGKKKGWVMKKI